MTQALSNLPEAVVSKINVTSLEEHEQHHMPITIYGDEMNQRVNLLKEHSPIYQEKLRFDITPLADEIHKVVAALVMQEDIWKKSEITRDSKTRYWHKEKVTLYKTNHELSERLYFDFKRQDKEMALEVIKQIGSSGNDSDAIDDGRRFKILLTENRETISVYSAEEIDEMITFYTAIEEARNCAQLDKTAPHDDRILRDKIYLYLRELEVQVYDAADAAFCDNPKERSRYVSAYIRRRNRKYQNKKAN